MEETFADSEGMYSCRRYLSIESVTMSSVVTVSVASYLHQTITKSFREFGTSVFRCPRDRIVFTFIIAFQRFLRFFPAFTASLLEQWRLIGEIAGVFHVLVFIYLWILFWGFCGKNGLKFDARLFDIVVSMKEVIVDSSGGHYTVEMFYGTICNWIWYTFFHCCSSRKCIWYTSESYKKYVSACLSEKIYAFFEFEYLLQ